ncbi:sensor histidine kinase [Desulfopila sp. IMCC35008]|uniref:sensor histidine kinase n=1 Tax=Desulfopila sp. IMCC35008 TaxID=2653858 RepID=UPI0013CF963A|nr:HAMP domain-containing sensor histidine kinase [Desulfopila sp. IMCC35008]
MVWNFILYLLYGLAFFTLGVAILSRDTRLSELGIARILWLLAVFGIVHGFHEWLELLEQLNPDVISPAFFLLRLLLVSSSFLFLLYFGIFLNLISLYGDHALKTTPDITKVIIGAAALALILLAIFFDFGSGTDINIRRMVGFPGGLLSGIGLIIYSRTVRTFSRKVAANFIFAGGFMICYAVFTGIIPSDYVIPAFNTKIIMLRGGSAFLIMFFTIKALSVFSLEQRKLIDEQLQRFAQSEKLTSMGILAAGIAHEINNPLTNASLNLEMLKDLVSGEEKVDKKLESIDRNILRASTIAKELLHFSREKETSFEPVNLNEVIRSSNNLIKNQRLSSIIHLQLNQVPDIMGIPHKLEEVFINLLMNSIDACEEGDFIEIETSHHLNQVTAEITDTGHGIQADHIKQVFDPFFTNKGIGKGTGLGLSVCYNIVKQHHGDISLVSSQHGGAVVTITLPVAGNHE